MFAYIGILKNGAKHINTVCKKFVFAKSISEALLQKLSIKQTKENRKTIEKLKMLLIYGQLSSIISALMFTAWEYQVLKKVSKENGGHALLKNISFELSFLILYWIHVYFTLFGPISCAVELIISQLTHEVADLFTKWQDILRLNLKMTLHQDSMTKTCHNLLLGDIIKDNQR